MPAANLVLLVGRAGHPQARVQTGNCSQNLQGSGADWRLGMFYFVAARASIQYPCARGDVTHYL